MKHICALFVLSMLLFVKSAAQNPISVKDDTMRLENNTAPAFSVLIPENNYETVSKEWIKLLQSGTRSKVAQRGNNISIFGAKVKPISDYPVNVYSQLFDRDGGVEVKAAFETEKDNYIGQSEFANARRYMFDFGKERYMAVVEDQLNKEKKLLRELQGDLNSLQRDQARMEKSDKDNAAKIEEEQKTLADAKDNLAKLSDEKYQGDTTSTGMGAPSASDMKDMEKERKRLNRDIKSSEKSIDKAQSEIAQNKRDMPKNLTDQETAKRKVEQQEEVVKKVEEKLETIKKYR